MQQDKERIIWIVLLIAVSVVAFIVVTGATDGMNKWKTAAISQADRNNAIIECIEEYEYTNSMPCQYDWHYE